MLEAVLNNIHNFFIRKVERGTFTISSGTLESNSLLPDQYFCIRGSVLNDGVHKYPAYDLKDETFAGEIWLMAVPPAVVALSQEIGEWCSKNEPTNLASEAFGGYSYTRASTPSTGAPMGWEGVFRGRLNAWRKLR